LIGISPKRRDELLARCRGLCEAQLPRCTNLATAPHHKKLKSRGGSDDMINILATCQKCHNDIHLYEAGTAKFRTHSWQEEGQTEADA